MRPRRPGEREEKILEGGSWGKEREFDPNPFRKGSEEAAETQTEIERLCVGCRRSDFSTSPWSVDPDRKRVEQHVLAGHGAYDFLGERHDTISAKALTGVTLDLGKVW